jgi:molybdenum cofactor cytidylyltransferase
MGLVAIVLAAGRATRFGADKLSALIDGRSVLDRSVEAALAAPVDRVLVVTRAEREIAAHPKVEKIEPGGADLSDSLRSGLAAAGDAEGAFIFLGDMPLVPKGLAGRLAQAIGTGLAAVPVCEGEPGHPVLLARRGFGLAEGLSGDSGLGTVLRGRADVVHLPTGDAGATFDIDTPSDLATARGTQEH